MFVDVVGDLLVSAVAVGLSPIPIVAVIVLLASPGGRAAGMMFTIGWIAGVGVVATAVTLLADGTTSEADGPSSAVGWLQLVFGAVLVVLAARKWRSRPETGVEPEPPRWMAGLESSTPARAAGLGAALGGVNPKNLLLTVAAAATIGSADLPTAGTVGAVVVYVAIASVSVVGATAWSVLAPVRSRGPLGSVRRFLLTHNAVIMMTLLLVLGVKLLGDGIAAIAD